jgi:hypothetical protein
MPRHGRLRMTRCVGLRAQGWMSHRRLVFAAGGLRDLLQLGEGAAFEDDLGCEGHQSCVT